MNAGMDTPFERREEPGKRKALVLAILVHALLAAFLFFGVRWQTKHEAVQVELWSDVPPSAGEAAATRPPEPVAQPKPEPKPEPKAEPKPQPRPEPKPEPKPEMKPLPKPDIALKDEKKKPEPKKEEPKKPEPKKEEPKKPEPKKEEPKKEEVKKPEVKKEPAKPQVPDFSKELEKEQQQTKRQQREADMRAQMSRDMDREMHQLGMQQGAGKEAAAAGARNKGLASYIDKIRAKVRGNLGFVSVTGNPVAKFRVTQLPSGEIISAHMIKSSGIPAYDSAVERAIMKSSPLPLPDDKSAFDRELELTFCPQEGANGCPR